MIRKIALSLVLSLLVSTCASAQQWASKMFQETSHDFGTVARNAKSEYSFVLENLYMEDVHLASVRTSCGCTTPRIEKQWLKTYEQGAVIAHLNTDSFQGRRGATLTVTIDKPFYAEVQLEVRAFIRSDVVIYPGSVNIGTVDQGTAVEKKVTVNYAGRSTWRILEVRSPNPHVSGRLAEKRRGDGEVAYDLVVRLDESAPAGRIREHLVLVTNDRERPQVPVAVEGLVEAGITVNPGTLFLGVLQPGQKVTKQLVVRSKTPFRILSITCPNASFLFDTSAEQQPKTVHLVPVTFVAGDEAGRMSQMIHIETDLGIEVPDLSAYAVIAQ